MIKVLIIEDSKTERLIIKELLVGAGYHLEFAEDGEVGLEKFHHSNIDIVLTDIMMPNKEGLEIILHIKKTKPAVKVIAMSSNDHYLETAKLLREEEVKLVGPF